MGRPVATLFVLCFISVTACSLSEQATRGRLLAGVDATPPAAGGAVAVPIYLSSQGLYVANFTIGTPPQPVSAVVDLTGELVWTQCTPCQPCFEQDLPLFDPTKSSTFRGLPCGSHLCESIPESSRNCTSDVCIYEAPTKAGDTGGMAGTDTFAIGAAKETLGFGCVVMTDKRLKTIGGPSGIVGLGRTPWSLVTQMNVTAFSYCLAGKSSGALFLGATAKQLAGGKNSSTPFVIKTSAGSSDNGSNPYYMVKLAGIKAGGAPLQAASSSGSTVLLDTVSRASYLADGAYKALKKALTAAVGVQPVASPPKPYDLCFSKAVAGDAPELVFTFDGGAALTVPPANYLLASGNGTVCLTIGSSASLNLTGELEGASILGSLQQENVHVLFDLKEETLSFKPADCSSLT
ncbi:hypothetical protein OsI_34489 [Oryza sativa Indica Group]|uniref:Peptidase A1 domain-containing protein n=1 Tax=Oryza sativa subsp. indica TaxID=39946 RepID=A2Z9S7_ORYSI|nr:hypothetical protein OsI_34489 [Oryza sativa Indica Group]